MKAKFFLLPLLTILLSISILYGAPVVTNITPAVGQFSGGTTVLITGSGFTGATAVSFGSVPAITFTLNSDNLITAISPPHSPQVTSINITTPSGTSPSTLNSLYTYQGNSQVYVVNSQSADVFDIDTTINVVVAMPGVGNEPVALNITPDGSKVYVANHNDDTVSVIDTATNTVIGPPIAVGHFPVAIAITPNGVKAYVANQFSNNISVIDTTTNMVLTTIPIGNTTGTLAVTPDGSKVYVVNQGDGVNPGSIVVVDTANDTVIATLTVGIGPINVALTPDGTKAYVTNQSDTTISVIDTTSNTVIATPTVGSFPNAIAITPDGTKVYVANFASNNISVINTTSNIVIATLAVGTGPVDIAITPDGTTAYVINQFDNTVSVIDTTSDTVVGIPIGVGTNPLGIAITNDGTKAYVVNRNDNTVSIIDVASNIVIGNPIGVGTAPIALAITPDQAPLAKFNFNLVEAGSASTFDASASASPIGEIVNYSWDFGDGTTLNTLIPIITHTYTIAGSYSVILTVTNSAGTSTHQIFRPSISASFGVNSTFLTNNGGPTATLTQTVTILPPLPPLPPPPTPPTPPPVILPSPPTHLKVIQVKDNFSTQTDLVNIITWKSPSSGPTPTGYQIYRDQALTELIGIVTVHETRQFRDHNRKKNHAYTYFIVTVDQTGNKSKIARITWKG